MSLSYITRKGASICHSNVMRKSFSPALKIKGKDLFMPRKLLVGKGKRKHTKKPNGLVPSGIKSAIRQLFYFLFPCWFTPKGNWNKAIMLLILNFLYQNGLFLLNHNQNEKEVELLLKYMVFFDLCN